MNLFSCGAVNACAQHDEKSRHEAEMHEFILMRRSESVCLLPRPPPHPPPQRGTTFKKKEAETPRNDQAPCGGTSNKHVRLPTPNPKAEHTSPYTMSGVCELNQSGSKPTAF